MRGSAFLNCNPWIHPHPADSTGLNLLDADWPSNFANPTDQNLHLGQSNPVGALMNSDASR